MKYGTRYWQSVAQLSELSKQHAFLQQAAPAWKFFAFLVLLLLILGSSSLSGQAGGVLLVLTLAKIGKLPLSILTSRFKLALPFVLFIGLSNILFDQRLLSSQPYFTQGMLSCLLILLRTFSSIGLMTIFVATTTREKILSLGKTLHVPTLFLQQLELTLRYVGVLVEEAERMYRAYHLKQPNTVFLAFRDMGAFLGLLLLRTLARAERVYQAMECRGYGQGEDE